MNTQPIEKITERISLFISDNYAEPRWVEIDTTGAAPETVNGFERATGTDAAVPIYRSPALTRSRYAMLEELVKISSGIAPAEGAHREQMRALRERVEAAETEIEERAQELSAGAVKRAMARADDAHKRYKSESASKSGWQQAAQNEGARAAAAELRTEKIIEEARRWKRRALAAETEADTLHAAITSAELRVRTAERDRDIIETKLDRALVDASRAHTLRREAQAERLDSEARIVDAQAKALSTIEKIASLIPAPEVAERPPFEISTYYGIDNVPVVEIDTQLIDGRLRINLNDAPIWDGDPETDERPGANLDEEQSTVIAHAEIRDVSFVNDGTGTGHVSVEVGIVDSDSTLGRVAFAAPRQEEATTPAKHVKEVDDLRARIEELEEDVHEARGELAATKNALTLSEKGWQAAIDLGKSKVAEKQESIEELQAERDKLAEKHADADDMRRRLDEQLADVTRAGAITAAGLRAMIRQRDEILRKADDLADRVTDGGTGGPSSGDLLAAQELGKHIGLLPKLDDERVMREDDSVLQLIRTVERVVRFWRAAPTSVVTEQLNIALSDLANLAKR